jgi:chemotaxis protein CheZ
MSVRRKRFRIEEAIAGEMPMFEAIDSVDAGPMHREIMDELRAIRAQMAHGRVSGGSAATAAIEDSAAREVAEAYSRPTGHRSNNAKSSRSSST